MIDTGDRKPQGIILGNGSPNVVLISGFSAIQESWNPIVPVLSELSTAITYN